MKRLAACLILLSVAGCSTDVSKFTFLKKKKAGSGAASEIARYETAAQGSGVATSSGHRLTKVTIGGSYDRKTVNNATSKLSTGLHGRH